jgi:hypothetical protein
MSPSNSASFWLKKSRLAIASFVRAKRWKDSFSMTNKKFRIQAKRLIFSFMVYFWAICLVFSFAGLLTERQSK